jgi:5-methylcytosine-specific restriction endonuclease McrA
MAAKKRSLSPEEQARVMAEMHREKAQREKGYRARALKLLPHLCASCGREFEGKRLKELTVHHKDHDHRNNPPDGSNWELLCIYCHDHEHEKHKMKGFGGGPSRQPQPPPLANPFDALDQHMSGESGDGPDGE